MKKNLVVAGMAIGIGILVGEVVGKRLNKKMKNLEEEQKMKADTNEDLLERIEKLERHDVVNTEAIGNQCLFLIATLLILSSVLNKLDKASRVFDPILEPGKKYNVDEFLDLLRENETYITR